MAAAALLAGSFYVVCSPEELAPSLAQPAASDQAVLPESAPALASEALTEEHVRSAPAAQPLDAGAVPEAEDIAAQLTVLLLAREDESPLPSRVVRVLVDEVVGEQKFLDGETDHSGAVTFDLKPGFPVASVEAVAGGGRPIMRESLEWLPLSGQKREVVISVPLGGSVAGRVLGQAGIPEVGASVRWWNAHPFSGASAFARDPDGWVQTDQAGSFRIVGLSGQVSITASSDSGRSDRILSCVIAPGDNLEDADFTILPLTATRIHVCDSHGRNLPNARVVLVPSPLRLFGADSTPAAFDLWSNTHQPLVTDAEGEAILQATDGSEWNIVASAEGYGSESAFVGKGERGVLITLIEGRTLEGRVVDSAGSPVPDCEVKYGGYAIRQTSTNSQGEFELSGLADKAPDQTGRPRHFPLGIHRNGFAIQVLDLPPIREVTTGLTITLERGLSLAGYVLEPTGEPRAHCEVVLSGGNPLVVDQSPSLRRGYGQWWVDFLGVDRETSDANGAFRFEDLPAGDYFLTVHRGGFRSPIARAQVAAGSEAVEITIGQGLADVVSLFGEVTQLEDGRPVQSFLMQVYRDGQFSNADGFSNPKGEYYLSDVRPGELRVEIKATDGSRSASYSLGELPPGLHRADFQLIPVHTLTVSFVDQEGSGISGEVEAYTNTGLHFNRRGMAISNRYPVAPNGEVQIPGLLPGPVRLVFFPSAYSNRAGLEFLLETELAGPWERTLLIEESSGSS